MCLVLRAGRATEDVSRAQPPPITENDNDAGTHHAYIVYTQCKLERSVGLDGEPTNDWAFEVERTLPQSAPTIQLLWGNGPEGRRGTAGLLADWRESLCTIDSEVLPQVGAPKRYDHRSCDDRGAERRAGEHMGPVRSALCRRDGEEAPHHDADEAWAELERKVLQIGEAAEAWEADDRQRVRDAIDLLRLESGVERDGERSSEGSRRVVRRGAGRRRADRRTGVLAWVEEMRARHGHPEWIERWRDGLASGLNGDDVAALALGTMRDWKRQCDDYTPDMRPGARAVLAAVRSWKRRVEGPREDLERLHEEDRRDGVDQDTVEQRPREWEERGVRLR